MKSYDMNCVQMVGRLTRDPERRETQSGKAVCSFSLAVNAGEEAYFFQCTAWEKLAETVKKFCKKGDRIGVTGKLQQRKYTDKEGHNRTVIDVVASNVFFLSNKKEAAAEDVPESLPNEEVPF